MHRPLLTTVMALLLVSCGDAGVRDPAVVPSTYFFDKDDLWRSEPDDFCRAADDQFLPKLLNRVRAALPIERSVSVQFKDFNVPGPGADGRREADLRFTIDGADGSKILMFATGPFKAEGCVIGPMRMAQGANILAFDGQQPIEVP